MCRKFGPRRSESHRRNRRPHDAEARSGGKGRHLWHTHVKLGAGAADGLMEDAHEWSRWRRDQPIRAISTPGHGPRQGEKPTPAAERLQTQRGYDGMALRKVRPGRRQKQAKEWQEKSRGVQRPAFGRTPSFDYATCNLSSLPSEFGTMFSGVPTTTFGASICHLSSLLVSARVLDDFRGISCFVILT